MTEFDPTEHRMIPQQRWFEDFVVGERFVLPSRTQTAAVFAAFQTASGDTHPVHYDVEYCRSRGMPHLLAHGFQTLIHTAPGAGLFPFTFSRHTLPAHLSPVPGETFVFTEFAGEPQVFLTAEQLIEELSAGGFEPDGVVPLHELNRPQGPLCGRSGPVIWEGTFRRR